MNEVSVSPLEITSVNIKVGGQIQRLIVTENYVKLHGKKWILREDTSFIPLNSIDSIFFGWKRYVVLAIVGLVLIFGVLVSMAEHRHAEPVLILGFIFLVVFWFYRPSLLLVRSSKESLGGKPISIQEAEKFISELTKLLNRKNS
jgi:hypothetical protein